MSHAIVRPARIRLRSEDLHTTVVRGVGWRGKCGEHWLGPVRTSWAVAREDARIHSATCQEKGPAA